MLIYLVCKYSDKQKWRYYTDNQYSISIFYIYTQYSFLLIFLNLLNPLSAFQSEYTDDTFQELVGF